MHPHRSLRASETHNRVSLFLRHRRQTSQLRLWLRIPSNKFWHVASHFPLGKRSISWASRTAHRPAGFSRWRGQNTGPNMGWVGFPHRKKTHGAQDWTTFAPFIHRERSLLIAMAEKAHYLASCFKGRSTLPASARPHPCVLKVQPQSSMSSSIPPK